MEEQIKFLTECDKVLYHIYDTLDSRWDKVATDEQISQFWRSDKLQYNKNEILNHLKRVQLLRTIEPNDVQLQDKGKEFCRKQDSLVQQFKYDQQLREGEKSFAKLTTFQLQDYTLYKLSAVLAFIISAISLFIATCTYIFKN